MKWAFTLTALVAVPSAWIEKLALPAFFLILGTLLSLFVSEWKEQRQAKHQKQAFLRAIGMELDALTDQLNASLPPIDASLERLEHFGAGPHLLGIVRDVVFTSQLGKLRDVDDPLIMQLIKFYLNRAILLIVA